MSGRKPDLARDRKIVDLFQKGVEAKALSARFGLHHSAILKILDKNGIDVAAEIRKRRCAR